MSTQTPDTTTATLSADCSPLHVAMLARDEAKRTEDALALIAAMKIEEKALGEQFMILTGLEKVPGSSRGVQSRATGAGCPGADPAPACGAEGGDHQGARTGQRGCA